MREVEPGYMTLGMTLKRAVHQQGEDSTGILYGSATPASSDISNPLLYIREVYLVLWKENRKMQPFLVLFFTSGTAVKRQ